MAVPANPIVEDFDIVEDIGPGQITGRVDPLLTRSFFRLEKKDSATALAFLC